YYSLIFFFFSSRRRHTRSKRDWSSDVCSSDLTRNLWFSCWSCIWLINFFCFFYFFNSRSRFNFLNFFYLFNFFYFPNSRSFLYFFNFSCFFYSRCCFSLTLVTCN